MSVYEHILYIITYVYIYLYIFLHETFFSRKVLCLFVNVLNILMDIFINRAINRYYNITEN